MTPNVTKNLDNKTAEQVESDGELSDFDRSLLAETSERFDSTNTELKCEDTLLGCI